MNNAIAYPHPDKMNTSRVSYDVIRRRHAPWTDARLTGNRGRLEIAEGEKKTISCLRVEAFGVKTDVEDRQHVGLRA